MRRTCGWWNGWGRHQERCHNRATHEWKSNAGADWSPRCEDHRVTPLKEGPYLRQVRELPAGGAAETQEDPTDGR